MFTLLRVVMLGSWMLAALSLAACSAIPSAFTDRINQVVKDNGAGKYEVQTTLKKDGKPIVGITEAWDCTASAVQLTRCHQDGVTFTGPQ